MPTDWVPALSSTSLLAVALWLSRNLIAERLKSSVKHDYDKEIETLRTALRNNEESFKSDLKAKESQIEALRSGALSGIVSRQEKLYQRRIVAVEQLWEAVISLGAAKNISKLMATIKFEAAAKESARNPQFREIFSILDDGFGVKNINTKDASVARPFLSPLAWALFSAYQSIIIHAVIKMQALKSGLDKDFTDVTGVTKVVKAALPQYEDYIEEHGPSAYHYLLDVLETNILEELDKMLKDEGADKESIEKAARILKESECLMESNTAIKSEKQPIK